MEESFAPDQDFAHAPPQRSWIAWLFMALGPRYAIALPIYALLACVLAVLAIWKFKVPYLTAMLVIVVPLPLYCGAVGMIDGLVASFQVIALSSASPKSSEMAEGAAMSLVSLQVGLVLSMPLYLLGLGALCWRAFTHREPVELLAEPPIGAVLASTK